MYKLMDVRDQLAPYAGESGMCANDERLIDEINEARRVIFPLGDWKGTVDPICVKPCCSTISLPAIYEYAKEAFVCSRPVVVRNDWFDSVPSASLGSYCGRSLGQMVQVIGRHVTFRDWYINKTGCCEDECRAEGFFIKVILENKQDSGVQLHFKGIGAHDREISLTRNVTTAAYEASLASVGEERMLGITYVSKPITKGRIRIYGYDGTNELLLAIYDPQDVDPFYVRYAVRASTCVIVKAKRRYIPLVDDDYSLLEIHPDAMIHVLQAIAARRARNSGEYTNQIAAAVAFLNRELHGPQSTSTSAMRMSPAYRVTGLT